MNQRQQILFKNIVNEHVTHAKAIGSKFLVDKYKMDVSPATIRNDMAELEKLGLIEQPHTSAGRIPTEAGYQYYIDNYLSTKPVSKKDQSILEKIKSETGRQDHELLTKNIAKQIADLSDVAVIVGFSKDNFYYTGISNLFHQPEFANFEIIQNMGQVIDHLDEVIENIFDSIEDTEIKVGRNCHFSKNCSSILTKVDNKLFGILGPMRMNYDRNFGLIEYTKQIIS